MIYLTKSENSASIINRSNDCKYPEKSIYRTYLFSTVKLIRFGAVFIVILMIVIPVFATSSDSTLMSKQQPTENALELIHNNFVQTEPGYQGFINTEKLQRINPETETNAAPMILSGGLASADLTIFANSRRAGSLRLYFFMMASKLTNS